MAAVASSQPSLWSMVLQRSTHHSKLRVLLSGVLEEKIRESPKPLGGRATDVHTRFAGGPQQVSWSASKLAASSSEHARLGGARYASATELRKPSHVERTGAVDTKRWGDKVEQQEKESAAAAAEEDSSSFKSTGTSIDERGTTPTASVASALESIALQDDASSCKSVLGRAGGEHAPSDAAESTCCADGAAGTDLCVETPSTMAVAAASLKKVWEEDAQQQQMWRQRADSTQPTGGASSSTASEVAHAVADDGATAHSPSSCSSSSPEMTGAAPCLPSTQICQPATQVCQVADLAPASADACGKQEAPESVPWHRLCFECGGGLDGSAYMLNDRAYCSEKHRLVASRREYFATRAKAGYSQGVSRSQSDETQLRCRPATVMPPSPSYGLLAQYKTWM